MGEFYLMHKDIEVAKLNYINGAFNVIEIYNIKHMPPGTQSGRDLDIRITRWHTDRCMPAERPNLKSFLSKSEYRSLSKIAIHGYGCSLVDCYWFKPLKKPNLKWKDVNFFDNGFNSNFGEAVFMNNISDLINYHRSPDVTTNGASPKMWLRDDDDGTFFLIKGKQESTKFGIISQEAIGEVFASAFAKKYGFKSVDYMFIEQNGLIFCASQSFINDDQHEFIPLEQFKYDLPEQTNEATFKHFCNLGFKEDLEKIIFFDYLLGNTDRHMGNLGIIRNPDTLEILEFAPIFDSGEVMNYNYQHGAPYDDAGKLVYRSAKENLLLANDFSWLDESKMEFIDISRLYRDIALKHGINDIGVINQLGFALGRRYDEAIKYVKKCKGRSDIEKNN